MDKVKTTQGSFQICDLEPLNCISISLRVGVRFVQEPQIGLLT